VGREDPPDLGDEVPHKVLRGEIATRTRDLLRQICQGREVVIVQGSISPDHVHMLVSVPPQLAPAKLVQYLKGLSSRMLQDEFPQMRKRYWGQHLWCAWVLLHECGRGRRRDHSALYRKSAVGQSRRKLQNHRVHRALKPALSREAFRRLQP